MVVPCFFVSPLPAIVIIGIMGAGMVCAAAAFIAFVRKDDSRNTKPKKQPRSACFR